MIRNVRYFGFDVGTTKLIAVRKHVTIDSTQYHVVEERQHFTVCENEHGNSWLIDFGYREDARRTIICNDAGELLAALNLVRAAFPIAKIKCKS
jgi:hypothetical protein